MNNFTILQQVIQTIKMKKYAWATQMNTAEASNIVIKRNRNARKISFTEPEDLLHLSKVLRGIETFKAL